MDVLMHNLKKVDSLEAKMFADDTGSGSSHLSANTLSQIKRVFDDFEGATGLALNLDKTYFLTTRPSDEHRTVRARLRVVDWSGVKVSGAAQYLGMPMGSDVDFGEAFYPRLTKFHERIRGYASTKASLSATSKILVANVFLLPLLYFPAQFLRCPTCYATSMGSPLAEWVRRARFHSLKWTRGRGQPISSLGRQYYKRNSLKVGHPVGKVFPDVALLRQEEGLRDLHDEILSPPSLRLD